MKFLIFQEVQLEKLKNNENVEVDPTRIILAAVENARLVFGSKPRNFTSINNPYFHDFLITLYRLMSD